MKFCFHFAFIMYGCCYLLSYAYGCRDLSYNCAGWVRSGYCRNNAYMSYMKTNCKKSCGLCGIWANWGRWSSCSRSCGGGSMTRRRTCSSGSCSGISTQSTSCNSSPCGVSQPVCNDYNRYCADWARKGECQRNPAYMKPNCRKSCGLCPKNGNWANWGRWSSCSKSCGGGSMTRSRTCSNPAPKNGGRNCAGFKTQSTACNKSPCPVKVDGNWGSWAGWTACSKTCGGGTRTRTRTCSNPAPKNGGRACQGSNRQTTNCNRQQCPVHGNWGSWTGWAACSKTCGGGTRARTRTCSNPAPKNGGRACQGSNRQTTNCNSQQCPVVVHGQWGAWDEWSPCSKSCGIGVSRRQRFCNNPRPQNGGRDCVGNREETRRCLLRYCPTAPPTTPPTPSISPTCGRPKRSRIVGGQVASNRDWPWQVGLQALDDDFIFCGGSLIDREWVLTAAHCIFRNNPSRVGCVVPNPGLRVVIGEFDVDNIDGHEVHKTISQVCMHPSYDHSIYNNDIALLRFDSPLTGYNETMLPVCLPSSRTNFPTGTNCSVTGWGKTSQTGWVSNKLRVAQVPILNHTQCKTQYLERTGDIVTDRMLCAGYQQGKIDSCKGDSGGPFVCEDRGRYVLVGATSWGVGCAQAGLPGVYTDIKDFVPWIDDVMSPDSEP